MQLEFSSVFENTEPIYYNLCKGAMWIPGGTSNGKLRKYFYNNKHIKTGRMFTRDYQSYFGIEPIIECIVYDLGKALGMEMAKEELGVATIIYRDKEVTTIINISEDFRMTDTEMVELQDYNRLVSKEEQVTTVDSLIQLCGEDKVLNMMLLDLIILNEDRHNRNIAILFNQGIPSLTPIYDNGYSLLYDDVRRIKDYRRCSRNVTCNAPIYGSTFKSLERLIKLNVKDILLPTVDVSQIVYKYKETYETILSKYEVNNIPLTSEWWDSIIEFIDWRLDYVKNIQADE